jgi:hypothetical protein
MKTYQIELKRVSYVNLTIEAETLEEAEDLAWDELSEDGSYGTGSDADWTLESIELDEPATDDSRSYGPHHQDENQFYGPSCRI